jgi:hypothetical protein
MVSMLFLSSTKDYEIGIYCFSSKHAALRIKSKDGLSWNQNNALTLPTLIFCAYPKVFFAILNKHYYSQNVSPVETS